MAKQQLDQGQSLCVTLLSKRTDLAEVI